MKWKLTLKYIVSTVSVTLLIVIINILILLISFLSLQGKGTNLNKFSSVEDITRGFSKNIYLNQNNLIDTTKEGKKLLNELNSWIQIIDKDGNSIYTYNVDFDIREKYTPYELINTYKYREKKNNLSTVLVGQKAINKNEYTYLMGYTSSNISKYITIFSLDKLSKIIGKGIVFILVIDGLVALFIGYMFSKSLTKPVKEIISGVEDLSEGYYLNYYNEKGIYKPVFNKLNRLSDTLKEKEHERYKLESVKNEWIANISHDIKTPLASISGYSELMSDDYDVDLDEVLEYSKIIISKANYIKELVDDLNLTMKLKSDATPLSKDDVNVVGLIRNCIIDILNDPRYEDIDINFKSSEEEIVLNIDKLLIKRVINNIIYNSIIHNDRNIKIDVSIKKEENVFISIKDNGKGISETDLNHIFDRYYRGTNTGEAHKGSGLGMAIARDIIKAHNGDIDIKSKFSEGTITIIKI